MGRDKALLPYRGVTLVEHMAQAVHAAAGSVALIGDPVRYSSLGYPVYPDKFAGCGPLGGIYTALSVSSTDWNLIVACDMPGVTAEVLQVLLAERRAFLQELCGGRRSHWRTRTALRRLPSALPAGTGSSNRR